MKADIENLFDEANNQILNKNYEKAEGLLLEIIKMEPKHYPSYEKLSQLESAKQNSKKAVFYLKKYLKYNNQNPDIWNQIGNIYFDLKDFKQAIKYYSKTVALDNGAYWAYYNIGLSVAEIGGGTDKAQEEAKNYFRRAIRLNPEYYPALNELGIYYQNKYDYFKAKDYFFRAIKANSNYKYPYFNLAKIYKMNNQSDKAKNFLLKAVKIDPAYASALNYLGIIYYEEENYNASLHYYTRALKVTPDYKYSYYNIGLILSTMGKYKKAYQAFLKAVEIDNKYLLAVQEKERLEKNYKDQIEFGEDLNDKDLDPVTYKNFATETGSGVNLEYNSEEEQPKDFITEKFGRNITKLAKESKLFEILGRETEINSILETLFSMKKNNPLLIGKAGVGKTAIVEGLAQRIVHGDVPDFFKDKVIIEINMGVLVAGTTFRGDFEKRLKNVVEEVTKNKNIILFIDEIHTILGAGETGGSNLDAANILKPALAKGDLRCIGATTIEEYLKFFQKDSALDRRFQKIQIEELNKEATFDILQKLKDRMVKHFNVNIDNDLLQMIIDLSDEEIKNRVFPDKAIDIMEKSLSRSALKKKESVDDEIIKNVIAEITGYNIRATEEERINHLLGMREYLEKRCLGQQDAIKAVSESLIIAKNKLGFNANKPDGIFLFTGPSGVGKSYLAKEIAYYIYGNYNKLVTINMSEYTESHSISKLLGSPPGYIGHDNVSVLNSIIQTNPSCVLLLDEIDKAHPEVLKIFLRIFEDGQITDTTGKDIFFTNVSIIMTSNIILTNPSIGFEKKDNNNEYMKLNEYFSKEFINRIDSVINFNYIEKNTARDIVERILIPKAKELYSKKKYTLNFDSKFIDYITAIGYDRVKGVRNIERFFEKNVVDIFRDSKAVKSGSIIDFSEESGKVKTNVSGV